jgi:hypothetical protein
VDAIEIKRGDSFDYGVEIPDEFADGHFVGWTVASQLRKPNSQATLIATLETSWANPATTRTLRLLKIDTTEWPLGEAEFDVQFTRTSDGYRLSTETATVVVIKDVTTP